MKEHIVVLGWYGKHNIGDESYKLTFPLLFQDFDFTFTDNLSKVKTPYDYVIVGGGNVISDDFFKQIENVKVPKLLLSVGLPVKEDGRNKPLNHFVTKMKTLFQHICVRDFNSFDFLSGQGLEVNYLPDFAFALKPDKVRGKEIMTRQFKTDGNDMYQRVVGVIMNGFLCAGNEILARDYITFHKVAFDLARTADDTNASFIFIPFGGDPVFNDRIPNSWVASRCKWWKKNSVVYDRLGVQDTLDLISACDAVISTRLHSSIFATIGGVPFIDLTHHDKNRVYLESIAKSDWSLDYWALDSVALRGLLNLHLDGKTGGSKRELLVMSAVNRQTLIANTAKFIHPKSPEPEPPIEEKEVGTVSE